MWLCLDWRFQVTFTCAVGSDELLHMQIYLYQCHVLMYVLLSNTVSNYCFGVPRVL